jgi:cobalt-zinc-cadmium efflux system protein
LWVDPATSLIIAGVILWSSWRLMREALAMSLGATPSHLKAQDVRRFLGGMRGVKEVHDLHIWSLSTTEVALTAHLVMPAGHPGDSFLTFACDELHDHFGIDHATLQIETSANGFCAVACDAPRAA